MIEFNVSPIGESNTQSGLPTTGQPVLSPTGSWFKLHAMKIVIVLGVLLLAFGVIIFIFFGQGFKENLTDMSSDGPTAVTGGALVDYTIGYTNHNSLGLDNVQLTVYYPQDSIVVRDGKALESVTRETFDLGQIAAGNRAEKKLSLFIIGDRGNIKNLRAQLRCLE